MNLGVYNWTYAGGSFEVEFRPNGVFYCKNYAVSGSNWKIQDNILVVDFKKYGVYVFPTNNNGIIEGYAQNDQNNWRRLQFVSNLSDVFNLIANANGAGSVWQFHWEGGSFEVQFHVDTFQHFVCPQFPAHSHWTILNNSTIAINWAQYGNYELTYNPAQNQFEGFKVGPNGEKNTQNWRKATFLRPLAVGEGSVPSHDHSHEHGSHCGSGCGHDKKSGCGSGDCGSGCGHKH